MQYYLDKGGVIMYILSAMAIVGTIIIIWKMASITLFKFRTRNINLPSDRAELRAAALVAPLEVGLTTLKIVSTISPLLGLLGTVLGIFMAFEGIMVHGLGDPTQFAKGISTALITTVGGLVVAIPAYVFYNYFIGALDKTEQLLTQKIAKIHETS